MHKWHKVRHGQSRRTFTFIGCTFIFLQEFHFFHISIHMHFSCMRSLSQATISIQFLTEIINKIIHSQMSVLIFFEIKLKSICYYTYIHFIQKKHNGIYWETAKVLESLTIKSHFAVRQFHLLLSNRRDIYIFLQCCHCSLYIYKCILIGVIEILRAKNGRRNCNA